MAKSGRGKLHIRCCSPLKLAPILDLPKENLTLTLIAPILDLPKEKLMLARYNETNASKIINLAYETLDVRELTAARRDREPGGAAWEQTMADLNHARKDLECLSEACKLLWLRVKAAEGMAADAALEHKGALFDNQLTSLLQAMPEA